MQEKPQEKTPVINRCYVVVCQDMPLSHQAVQAVHAGISAGREFITEESPYLVLCTVPSGSALIALSARLSAAGVRHRVFFEDDMGGRPTALGTELVEQAKRKHFRGLPLYRVEELATAC